jgi:hypothetical protein
MNWDGVRGIRMGIYDDLPTVQRRAFQKCKLRLNTGVL